MKTFNLTIAALSIAAVASTSAFAASLDSHGNIPNHESDAVAGYSDSIAAYADETVKPAAGLSASDALVLQLSVAKDNNNRH